MKSTAASTIGKARFFLDCADKASTNERVSLVNHLEAAIVFARSVTFHLQKEFSHQPEFANWYSEHQKSLAQNQLARFLLEQRNYVLKVGPIATHRVVQMAATVSAHASCSATITVKRGAPWYRRSLRVLWEDATYPVRVWYHHFRERQRLAKDQKQIERRNPVDTTRDDIYFSHSEWKSEPAIELVRRLLSELEVIVRQAEQKFILAKADKN